MTTDFSQKKTHFSCEKCQYKTDNKKDYSKHLLTLKHKKAQNDGLVTTKNPKKSQEHICCNCEKTYKYRDGLWRHKKICKEPTMTEIFLQNDPQQLTELVMKVVEHNQELTKQIVELSKNSGSNNNNIINSNNKFNLNVFLNEQCKDAINITDFVSELVVSVKDLEETARLGYSEGISKIFIKGLSQLDTNTRPIHCSDNKREILYIKDAGHWEKESLDNERIIKAIKYIAHKNMKMIAEWTKQNPDYNDSDSKTNDKYIKIIMNSMSGSTEEEQTKNINKIISNVAKEIVINK